MALMILGLQELRFIDTPAEAYPEMSSPRNLVFIDELLDEFVRLEHQVSIALVTDVIVR